MIGIQTQIRQLDRARKELRKAIRQFPQHRRDEILFGRWNLKDVVGHFSAWSHYSVHCLESVRKGKEPIWELNVPAFNRRETAKRKGWNFPKLLKEFDRSSRELVRAYGHLAPPLWDRKFWPKRRWTPRKFLEIDLAHYHTEHLPKIKKFLKNV